MQSPITGGNTITLERKIPSSYVIKSYLESYGIDVTDLFNDKAEVEQYRCAESGFRFYGPEHLAGDSKFYGLLQEFPWYYMDWKWEHQLVYDRLSQGQKVLEIGCAEGAFIKRLDKASLAVGLELNEYAVDTAQMAGLDVRNETIQTHATANPEKYDVVCSFQVMEHVSDVKGILKSSIDALSPGGTLIISVPNNDSFIRHSPDSILNMPPHHMCLWDEGSLKNLEEFFDIDFESFAIEPLQKYHYPVICNNWIEQKCGRGIFGKVIKKLAKWTGVHHLVGLRKNQIKGHSIIAYFTKRG